MDQDHRIAGARLKIIGLYAISVCGRADLRILASCHAPLHPGSLVMPRAARASASGQSVTLANRAPLSFCSAGVIQAVRRGGHRTEEPDRPGRGDHTRSAVAAASACLTFHAVCLI